jgi:hypothetical protein
MEIDWRDTEDVLEKVKIQRDKRVYCYLIESRHELQKYRLTNEFHATKSIYLFGGDFISETYPQYPGLSDLPEKEIKVLKKAIKRGVDVKVLAHFDQSAPPLTHAAKRYVDEGIPIRKWNGDIRGGIFEGVPRTIKKDDEKKDILDNFIYVIERQPSIPPSGLTDEVIKSLPDKTVGKPQRDEDVSITALVTNSKYLFKKFKAKFNYEWKRKRSAPMEEELERIEEKNGNNNLS